jgi:hypothetical protein
MGSGLNDRLCGLLPLFRGLFLEAGFQVLERVVTEG